jgi:hypothetical protein
LALFLNLYVGHLLGDFVFQPGRLVLAKRSGSVGLLVHVSLIGLCSAAAVWDSLQDLWAAVLLATAAHLAIELLTIFAYNRTSARGLFTFMLDQTMHVFSIGVVAWLFSGATIEETASTFGVETTLPTLAGFTGLLVVALLGSILSFETANAALVPKGGKGEILEFDVDRVTGMIERAAGFLFAVVVHPALVWVGFVPRTIHAFTLPPGRKARRLAEIGSGMALCLFAYGLVVFVVYVAT